MKRRSPEAWDARPWLAALLLAGALGGWPAMAPAAPAAGQPLAAIDLRDTDLEYLLAAARSSRAQLLAADLALTYGDAEARGLARQLRAQNQALHADLQRIAASHGVPLSPSLSVAQQGALDGLEGIGRLAPDQFGSHFVARIGQHAQQERLERAERFLARPGGDPQLRRTAAEARDFARANLAAADLLARAVAVPDWTPDPMVIARASDELGEAALVLARMRTDPAVARALREAHALLIVTDSVRAAAGVGVSGGRGVLLTRQDGEFARPVFVDVTGISLGAQVGASAGEMAFLLGSEQALQRLLREQRLVSLRAAVQAGDQSARGRVPLGEVRDVQAWTGRDGLYAGAAIGVQRITPDAETNEAWYGHRGVDPAQILAGKVRPPRRDERAGASPFDLFVVNQGDSTLPYAFTAPERVRPLR